MAEAVSENTRYFYCHQCADRIPTVDEPDFTCPRCKGGFIEEIFRSSNGQATTSSQEGLNEESANLGRRDSMDLDASDEDTFLPGGQGFQNIIVQLPHGFAALPGQGLHGGMPADFPFGNLIQQILGGITGGAGGVVTLGGGQSPFGQLFGLHANPGDYVWGPGGLDDIITQLMNQLEGTGPPPAPQDRIDSLSRVTVSERQVEQNLQCNVCFEDYKVGESDVLRLPCQHLFHEDCIIPWLQRRGTCPVCRKTLDGEDTSCAENAQSIPDTLEEMGLGSSNNTPQPSTSHLTTTNSSGPEESAGDKTDKK